MPSRFEYERAIRSSELPPLSRLLTLTLATWADVKTGIIPAHLTPSLSVLEAATGMDRSTVRRHLNKLETDGWLGRDRPNIAAARAKKARTRYRLRTPKGFAVPESDGNELGADDTEARGAQPLAEDGLGAQDPMTRGTLPLELGAVCTTTRGCVPLSSSIGPPTSFKVQSDQADEPGAQVDDGIPAAARPLVDAMTASGVVVRWTFKGDQWFPVLSLIASRGVPAMVKSARKIHDKYDPERAPYFLKAWGELPRQAPPTTERPPLTVVKSSGYQPFQCPPAEAYLNDQGF
jgi:hypothetical protein